MNRTVINRGRFKTPGRFATEVNHPRRRPQLQIHYKSSNVKAYLKEGRALRVETTINNAEDFAVHKTLNAKNWRALRKVGAATNARFLAALGEGPPGLPDAATLESVVMPTTHDGQRPGLRFGDPPTMALLASVAAFALVVGGLTNQALRQHMAVTGAPTTPRLRPATTSVACGSRASSSASRTPTPTPSPPEAGAWRRSSPSWLPEPCPPPLPSSALIRPPKPTPQPVQGAWHAYERTLDVLVRKRLDA